MSIFAIRKIKINLSILMDIGIIFFFFLLLFIFFTGGYTFKINETHLKARSLLKPSLLLCVFIFIKMIIADYKSDREKNKILLYAVVVIVFLAGELGSRIYNNFFEDKDLFWVNNNLSNHVSSGILTTDSKIEVWDLIRLNSNKRISFELVPNLKGRVPVDLTYKGYEIQINSHGFRDSQNFSKEKDPNEIRVIGLGDSEMFGWGVEFKNTYGEVLENELNHKLKNIKRVNFLNMGVPGYNTTMSVEAFLTKWVQFNPDFVVLAFHENDFNLPEFIIRKDSPLSFRRSFLLYYLAKRLSLLSNYRPGIAHLKPTPFIASLHKRHLIPEDYWFMFGKQPFRRELNKLKQKCDELGIPLIVFIEKMSFKPSFLFPEAVNFAINTSKDLGVPVLEWRHQAKDYLDKNEKNIQYLQVSHRDPHANKIGHHIKGKALASFIYPYMTDYN